jgi:hypothetical protein
LAAPWHADEHATVDAEGDAVDCRGGSGKEEHTAEVDVEAEYTQTSSARTSGTRRARRNSPRESRMRRTEWGLPLTLRTRLVW